MSFLNGLLLLGGLAVALPIVIHLLLRRKHKPVKWGPMFLLEQAVRESRAKLNIKQWLLLAMRCLAVALLAFAMARPVLSGALQPAGDRPVAAAVIVDASYSMAESFEDAVATANAVAASFPDGSEVTTLVAGGGTEEVESLALARPVLGPADLPAAIAAARDRLAASDLLRREIVVVSDFQARNWTQPAAAETSEDTVGLTLVPVRPAKDWPAVVVEQVNLSPSLSTPGRPVRVEAQLRSLSDTDQIALPVRLFVNGVQRGEQRLVLAADQSTTARFTATFEEPGPAALRIVAGDIDSPAASFYVATDVAASLPVAIVSGETGRPFGENPADFLELALSPSPQTQHLRTRVTSADLFDFAKLSRPQDRPALAVLADVTDLNETDTGRLRTWVDDGGALLVFAGGRLDPAWSTTATIDRGGVLPARVTGLANRSDRPATPADAPYAHPALTLWNDSASGRLGDMQLTRHWQLEPQPEARVVLGLTDGQPLIVEQRVGRGVVLMVAVPADGTWSNLPLRAGFLPLVQQLSLHAIQQSRRPTTLVQGSPLVVAVPADAQPVVETPAGRTQFMSVISDAGRPMARLDKAAAPGVYRVTDDARQLAVFAVNAQRGEAEPTVLSPGELAELARSNDASIARTADEFAQQDRVRRFGQEIWRPVWLVLMLVLFGELALGGWVAREAQP